MTQTMTMPLELIHGSHIVLQNAQVQDYGTKCSLHSHRERYPAYLSGIEGQGLVSSQQQQVITCGQRCYGPGSYISRQVTCYPYDDENNWFRVEIPGHTPQSDEVVIGNMMQVKLKHVGTGRYLNRCVMTRELSHEIDSTMYIDFKHHSN